nr:MAG TPA: hypothetical protein [Caudoviricetes sp.]
MLFFSKKATTFFRPTSISGIYVLSPFCYL